MARKNVLLSSLLGESAGVVAHQAEESANEVTMAAKKRASKASEGYRQRSEQTIRGVKRVSTPAAAESGPKTKERSTVNLRLWLPKTTRRHLMMVHIEILK